MKLCDRVGLCFLGRSCGRRWVPDDHPRKVVALATVLFTIEANLQHKGRLHLNPTSPNNLSLDTRAEAPGSCTATIADASHPPSNAMPKVKSYSAAWLSKNAPGHALFEPSSEASRSRALSEPYSSKKKSVAGPRRTIARRGTEVFVAVGREIRWGDLAYLKDEWTSRHSKGRSGSAPRIKREDSTQSVGSDIDLERAKGLRVS